MFKKIWNYLVAIKERISIGLFAILLGVGNVYAGLPAGYTPTGGGGSATDPFANFSGWGKEAITDAAIILGGIVFLVMAYEIISGFAIAKKNREWGYFFTCVVIAIISVILVIWGLNQATQAVA